MRRVYPNFLIEKVDVGQTVDVMRAYQRSFRQQVRVRIWPKNEAQQARMSVSFGEIRPPNNNERFC
jgi:hypothetical protein